jgi:hypothetical protein
MGVVRNGATTVTFLDMLERVVWLPKNINLKNWFEWPTVTYKEQAQRRGGDVSPKICLYLTIRYLSGGHY